MSQATAQTLEFEPEPRDFIPESELIGSDEIPVETLWQRKQLNLCAEVMEQALAERDREDWFVGGNMFVYYSAEQARAIAKGVRRQLPLFVVPKEGLPPKPRPVGKKFFKGPDAFAVVGGVVPRKRKVWVAWLEGDRLPDVVFELQSESTAEVDAGEKRTFYAEVFKTHEYFYYGPDDPDLGEHRDVLVGLRLAPDGVYRPVAPDRRGWIWSEVLDAYVGRWDGRYGQEDGRWVRLYDAQGRLIPTEAEREQGLKEEERRLKEEERRLKEEAEKRAEEAEERAAEAEKRVAAAEAEIRRLRQSGGS